MQAKQPARLPSSGLPSSGLPLSALLSQLLVAFTIEADNEFELRMPHRTTSMPAAQRMPATPWLVSLVMWFNCMKYVDAGGVSVAELERLARTSTNLAGMLRWRYIRVVPGSDALAGAAGGADTATAAAAAAGKAPGRLGPDTVIRATRAGLAAAKVWRLLPEEIEQRWRDRFGATEIDRLRDALSAVTEHLDPRLPDCLPILSYGLFSPWQPADQPTPSVERPWAEASSARAAVADVPLCVLLSRVVLAFVLAYESRAKLSLAISANVLRVLDGSGLRVRDLPALTGVSKESISMATGILDRSKLAVIEPDPAGTRWRTARLTPAGLRAQAASARLIAGIENRWCERFGEATIQTLRDATSRLAGAAQLSLTPPPTGWRARSRPPESLPHFPMILHRGGFPDGA